MIPNTSTFSRAKPAFLVNLEYCNKPVGCQKCRVFGHHCEVHGGEEIRELEVNQDSQEAAKQRCVDVDAGSAGQLLLESILASKGKAQESAEQACRNLNLAVANLVKSIEQGVISEWQKSNAVELPTDREFQTAMVRQVGSLVSVAATSPITPVANRF
ncbi:unnamed protein product [Linum trigynum]|uniref:Uncharacterized protein n=1 Tax=Linum trigynum TaxID=586398 RepID=A0AAV2G8M6_9ROSI